MGFIFQSFNLLPVYTVFENVEFPLLLLNLSYGERKKRVMETLEWLGLTSKINSRPPQLSGGECQRVAIARAMVKRPKLVLADEPTANLDPRATHELRDALRRISGQGKNVIMITHDLGDIIPEIKRIILIRNGKVVGDGDKDSLLNSEELSRLFGIKLEIMHLDGYYHCW
jgi:putative ABC transport system ATP-binding protein